MISLYRISVYLTVHPNHGASPLATVKYRIQQGSMMVKLCSTKALFLNANKAACMEFRMFFLISARALFSHTRTIYVHSIAKKNV